MTKLMMDKTCDYAAYVEDFGAMNPQTAGWRSDTAKYTKRVGQQFHKLTYMDGSGSKWNDNEGRSNTWTGKTQEEIEQACTDSAMGTARAAPAT